MERGMRTDTRKVVLYFGSILPLQGVDVVLDAIRLMENDPDYRFVMVGPIKDKDRVIADNVTYYEWLSQEELARSIADADICLAGHFNSNIEKAARTIPGKAYIYQAMERPMVLGDNPANRELFCETEGKIAFCEMGNARSLVEAIKRLG
jgi:glycosyltransferase involved in cell wall biosynthesis